MLDLISEHPKLFIEVINIPEQMSLLHELSRLNRDLTEEDLQLAKWLIKHTHARVVNGTNRTFMETAF